jgi:replicative DNA helicase Mcm
MTTNKTHNTDNTDNIDNTDNTDNTKRSVLPVLCIMGFGDAIFEENILEKILRFLAENKGTFTYDKIAEGIDKEPSNVRQALSRKKELFVLSKPDGKKTVIQLSEIAIKEINYRIEQYHQKIEQKEIALSLKKSEENEHERVINDVKNYLNLNKNNLKNKLKNKVLLLDFNEIIELEPSLGDLIIESPEEITNVFSIAMEELGLMNNVYVQIYNLPQYRNKTIEDLRSKDLNIFTSLTGRVVTLSDVRSKVVNAKFECPSCGTIISVLQVEDKFREPSRCSCGRRGAFRLISKNLVDTARLILEDLQEKTDNPYSKRMNCFLKDILLTKENMNLYIPGKEIILNGVLKTIPIPLPKGGLSTRFEYGFEVNSVIEMEEAIKIDDFSEEELEKIINLSAKIDAKGLDVLNDSFAPEIFGYNVIKQSLELQLASSPNEFNKKVKKNKLNILFIGDPGTAKTNLGEFAIAITPGAKKAVGGSASAVGITAAVVKDEYSGGWRLDPGAVVLAKDIVLIDELNNIKDEDKPKLQEALSEHTVTIDKATVHTKLKALTGFIGTANPVHGLFKLDQDLVKQFDLSPALINRFDLIFIVMDRVNEEKDYKIAERMNQREQGKIITEYSEEFLTKFFFYIKNNPNPKIDETISTRISKIYSKLRKYKTKNLNINPRVHVAFLQLCKSSAKIRLSENVEEKDIEIALNILSNSYFKTPDYSFFKLTKEQTILK